MTMADGDDWTLSKEGEATIFSLPRQIDWSFFSFLFSSFFFLLLFPLACAPSLIVFVSPFGHSARSVGRVEM